jgi:uncharacterized protein with PIN domain
MKCARCGIHTPRLTLAQTRCPECERQVCELMAADARRKTPRFRAKDFTGTTAL